jgi:SAM-dependent methyltransferase
MNVRSETLVTVVVNTYNRAYCVGRSIESVLSQEGVELEVVVVDDGSTDNTPEVLARQLDDRLVCHRQENLGLTAARNAGAQLANGRWLVFLDDDDYFVADGLHTLTAFDSDPGVALVSAGFQRVTPDGSLIDEVVEPLATGGPHEDADVTWLPGTFAVRREAFWAAGGFLVGNPAGHQSELFSRLLPVTRERGERVVHVRRIVVAREHRDPKDRPVVSPRLQYYGSRWTLERHRAHFGENPVSRSDYEGVAGVSAARVGDWAGARRYLARSAVHDPKAVMRWCRLSIALAPPIARRIWHCDDSWVEHQQRHPLSYVEPGPSPSPENLFLPWRYQENPSNSADSEGTPYWEEGLAGKDLRLQDPVYKFASRKARRMRDPMVVDIGCGTGHKLVNRIGSVTTRFVGVDQESAISIARRVFPAHNWISGDLALDETWCQIADLRADMLICADVIEHVPDPRHLLRRLREATSPGSVVVLSTPDRDRMGYPDALGPPANPRHIREWSMEGFRLLVEAEQFEIVQLRHFLPRSYSRTRTELNRTAWRALHGKAIPDRRSNMAVVLRARPTN